MHALIVEKSEGAFWETPREGVTSQSVLFFFLENFACLVWLLKYLLDEHLLVPNVCAINHKMDFPVGSMNSLIEGKFILFLSYMLNFSWRKYFGNNSSPNSELQSFPGEWHINQLLSSVDRLWVWEKYACLVLNFSVLFSVLLQKNSTNEFTLSSGSLEYTSFFF